MQSEKAILNNDRYLALIVGTFSFYFADLFFYLSGYYALGYLIVQWILIAYGIFLCTYSLVIHDRVQLPFRTILKVLFVPLTAFLLIYTLVYHPFSDVIYSLIIIGSIIYLIETPFDAKVLKLFTPNRNLQDRVLLVVFSIAVPLVILFVVSNVYLTLFSLVLSVVSIYFALYHLNARHRKESAYFAVMMQFVVLSLGFVLLIAPYQTDELLFDFYSALMILKGGNPYLPGALHNVFSYYSVPYSFRTPLTTGGYAKGLFYPALSAFIFLPAALLKIDPRYEVFAFTIGIILIAFFFMRQKNLHDYFPMLTLLFISDIGIFAFAGYSDVDIFWAFFLVITLITRDRPYLPSVTMGIALALKQITWVFFPFYLIFIWKEKGFKSALKSTLISSGIFLAINLPYIVLSPHAWFNSLIAPETMPLIGVGQGISVISFAGFYILNHIYFTAMFFTEMILLIILYFFRFEKYKYALTTFPLIIFFFNYRLLVNYLVLWPLLSFFLIWDVMKIDRGNLLKKIPRFKIKGFKREIALLALIIIIPVGSAPFLHLQNEPISINSVTAFNTSAEVDKIVLNITVNGNFSAKLQFRIYPDMFLGNASANGYIWNSSSYIAGKGYYNYYITPLNSTYVFPAGISFRVEAYYKEYAGYYRENYANSGNKQSNSSLKSIFGSA